MNHQNAGILAPIVKLYNPITRINQLPLPTFWQYHINGTQFLTIQSLIINELGVFGCWRINSMNVC